MYTFSVIENSSLSRTHISSSACLCNVHLSSTVRSFVFSLTFYLNDTYSGNQGGVFTPPPGRAKFQEARAALDPSNINDLDKLKKLLMRRALENIPNLISLQNEGNAIDRLYKRGMLTDDVHFRIQGMKTFFDDEFQQVQQDADELVPGWAQSIWPQAMQYYKVDIDRHLFAMRHTDKFWSTFHCCYY